MDAQGGSPSCVVASVWSAAAPCAGGRWSWRRHTRAGLRTRTADKRPSRYRWLLRTTPVSGDGKEEGVRGSLCIVSDLLIKKETLIRSNEHLKIISPCLVWGWRQSIRESLESWLHFQFMTLNSKCFLKWAIYTKWCSCVMKTSVHKGTFIAVTDADKYNTMSA